MRRFVSLRWLGLHTAMIVIVAGFLELGWWQLRRAEGGNALSWGYTFEWPLFAGFVVVFWIKAMRDELREARAADDPAEGSRGSSPRAGTTAGGSGGSPPRAGMALPAGLRDGRDSPAGAGDGADGDDDELAAYNAYLSRLNAEASRTGGWLTGRASRRQAASWAGRPAGGRGQPPPRPAPGKPPHMEV